MNEIQKSLTVAESEVNHYQKENALQRVALAKAATQETIAANVTRQAAEHAQLIEQQALNERGLYQKVMKRAKAEAEKQRAAAQGAQQKAGVLLQKAKQQLQTEHSLRIKAETEAASGLKQAALARDARDTMHKTMLQIKATADKIAADRDQLSKRSLAATQMIAVEQQATQEAKSAAQDMQKACTQKLSDIEKKYNALLKTEAVKSAKAEATAKIVTDRSDAVKKAIANEKAILIEEQEKAKAERAKWKTAMDNFQKEREAHTMAKGAVDASKLAMVQKAQMQLEKATELAKDKDALLAQLKEQLQTQAAKFEQASQDWHKVKLSLEARVKAAEESAAEANSKFATYTQGSNGALESAVDGQMPVDTKQPEEALIEEESEFEDGSY